MTASGSWVIIASNSTMPAVDETPEEVMPRHDAVMEQRRVERTVSGHSQKLNRMSSLNKGVSRTEGRLRNVALPNKLSTTEDADIMIPKDRLQG